MNDQIKALNKRIQEDLNDEEFDADQAASLEYDAKVIEIRTRVDFARPSAVLPQVADWCPRAPSPDFAVIRLGKSTELFGHSKMAAEAENVHSVFWPCFNELHVLSGGDYSLRPGQVTGRASDPLENRLGAPRRPPIDDCVVLTVSKGSGLMHDPLATTQDGVADPDPPSVLRLDGRDVVAACWRSLGTEHVAGLHERAP